MHQSPAKSNEALVRQLSAWLDGIDYEVTFWGEWMATKGGKWPEDFTARQDSSREANADLFDGFDTKSLNVLDVGAGPASIFGHRLNGKPITLSACDPLAPLYAKMASRHGVTWPVQTVSGFAEDLSAFYSRGAFDMVFCRNALDHSFDPIRGIEEMLLVLRSGGRVNLIHYANEAEKGDYVGFHQWNFDVVDGRPVIWSKNSRVDLVDRFSDCADVKFEKKGQWISFRFDKTAEPKLQENRPQIRIAELLLATRDAFLLQASRPAAKK